MGPIFLPGALPGLEAGLRSQAREEVLLDGPLAPELGQLCKGQWKTMWRFKSSKTCHRGQHCHEALSTPPLSLYTRPIVLATAGSGSGRPVPAVSLPTVIKTTVNSASTCHPTKRQCPKNMMLRPYPP